MAGSPMFIGVDCVSFYVEDLEEGLAFYSGKLGMRLLWKTPKACGLGMREGLTELVLVNEHNPVAQFKVDSLGQALEDFQQAGGILEYGPFEIDIGQCAVVLDPWGNRFCLLDMSKGCYQVDENGNAVGVG